MVTECGGERREEKRRGASRLLFCKRWSHSLIWITLAGSLTTLQQLFTTLHKESRHATPMCMYGTQRMHAGMVNANPVPMPPAVLPSNQLSLSLCLPHQVLSTGLGLIVPSLISRKATNRAATGEH